MSLWYTETLHEFFIAIPLWFVSAVLYTVFSIAAGARTKGLVETTAAAHSTRPAAAGRRSSVHRRPAWLIAVRSIAWLILLFQLALSIWLLTGEYTAYASKLPAFRGWLGATSLLHLAMIAVCVLVAEKAPESVGDETDNS